jgi:hypothetical protein
MGILKKIFIGAAAGAVGFATHALATFAGHALYDFVMQVKDDRREAIDEEEEE